MSYTNSPRSVSRSPVRRANAPVITLDTSAVATPPAVDELPIPLHNVSTSSPAGEDDSSPRQPVQSPSALTISSPNNFLSVPGIPRSRANSLESDSNLSGDTAAVSPSTTNEATLHHHDAEHENTSSIYINDRDALAPDEGKEAEFNVENNSFAFSPGHMSKLSKSFAAFHALGGLAGLEAGLRTDLKAGLSESETRLDGTITFEDATRAASSPHPQTTPHKNLSAQSGVAGFSDVESAPFADRKRVFAENRLPTKKPKSILQLMWMAYKDKVLIILSVAAVVSLAIGLYQSFGQPHEEGEAPVEWVEGVAITVAIAIVVIVGALNDYQKERQFVKLNKKKEERNIKVTRSGKLQEISVYDLLVGDLIELEPGDIVPVDGILVEGHNVRCDESSTTGESDAAKKTPANLVWQALEEHKSVKKMDPFIVSGGKVVEGIGKFLVTAVGVNSTYGKILTSLHDEDEATPLQSKLNVLAEQIAKLGGAAALLYFVVAFIEFLVRITQGSAQSQPAAEKGQLFLQIFLTSVTVVVVAIPEGLPLAVTLALAFATTMMLKQNNLVRVLRSCETMGNATTVCSDKTGTLTTNVMTVVAGTFGTSTRFGDQKALPSPQEFSHTKKGSQIVTAPKSSSDVTAQEFVGFLSSEMKDLLLQSIAVNTTAFEGTEDGKTTFIGSKTETALLNFASTFLGMGPVSTERANADVVQFVPFDSERKFMAAVVRLRDGRYRMYVKGASEILLYMCGKIIADPTKRLAQREITPQIQDDLSKLIYTYGSRSLRTIAFVYRDFESWPPKGARQQEDDPSEVIVEDLLYDLTFMGIVGIQDPLRDGVKDAVADCFRAGVFVRMVTGDNVQTAKAIATECGIYTPGGEIMEGPAFRRLKRSEMDKVIPKLQVLARSSPEDKMILVKRLKQLGETVAVTGDGTNDAQALKTADIGFSMGISGTEVAKEASAIILMDDNFSSIVNALMWGRAVNDSVKKFLQFQLTVNITAVLITFITGVSNEEAVLTPVQLLWVNLIMDTFAALALATDPPTRSVLNRKPDRKSARLISITMWKMIIGQAIYQLVVVLVLHFRGADILSYQSEREQRQLPTLIFNIYVWMQIFNAFNNRRLDNRFNIFEGIHRNFWFVLILGIMVGGQVLIIFVGGQALSVVHINAAQWAYSIVIGAITIPIGVIIRLIPDEFIMYLIPSFLKRSSTPQLIVEDEEQQRFEWNPAITEIRDQLLWLKKFKGGRLNNLKFKIQHPRESGLLLPRSSTASRSRSSTNVSVANQIPRRSSDQGNLQHDSTPRPSFSRQSPSPASHSRSHSRSHTPEPHSSPGSKGKKPPTPRRGRSRSNSGFGPAIAAAGIMVGSIGGWSPLERSVSPLPKSEEPDESDGGGNSSAKPSK